MITQAYKENPCRFSSIPLWKTRHINIPENMRIVHDANYAQEHYREYHDEPYFRLYHPLDNVTVFPVDGISVVTATQEDIPLLVDVINESYMDLSVTEAQLIGYTKTAAYCPELWITAVDNRTSRIVGCGIADLDQELGEGILEWIQVIPSCRGRKIGQLIVAELLNRMANIAEFATVSGKIHNPTSPETVYRKCGFVGNDIWHVLTKKK